MTASDPRSRRFRPLSTRVATAGLVALAVGAGFAGGRATLAAAQHPTVPPPAHVGNIAPQYGMVSYSAIVDSAAPAIVTVRVEKQADASRTALPGPFRDFAARSSRSQGADERADWGPG